MMKKRLCQRAVRNHGQLESLVGALRGEWCDDLGTNIHIAGFKAHFGAEAKTVKFESIKGNLILGDLRLVGTLDAPIWQCPKGSKRHWARSMVAGSDDTDWAQAFLSFKEERLDIRRQLRLAFGDHDLDQVMKLSSAWKKNATLSAQPDDKHRTSLHSGALLVPGVCFRHKQEGYRGVILGCEPWCMYPPAWRAKWVRDRPHGESQPFYYCLVDERDVKGGETSFVAEADIEVSKLVFPIKSFLVDSFLVPCDAIGGYLPNDGLERTLRLHRAGGEFTLGS
jgi:hemimethylated DNA binding protein